MVEILIPERGKTIHKLFDLCYTKG